MCGGIDSFKLQYVLSLGQYNTKSLITCERTNGNKLIKKLSHEYGKHENNADIFVKVIANGKIYECPN